MNHQKGVSLIITFLIMTIMLAVVLSISIILMNEIKIVSNSGSSVSSLYAADTGVEKTLYYDRKQIPTGATRGLCNICNACGSNDCLNCTATPLASNGCDLTVCDNCQITYDSVFTNRAYSVSASESTDTSTPPLQTFSITAVGSLNDATREVNSITGNVANPNPNPNPNIACSSNADCGTDGFNGSPFCLGGDVYQNFRTYTCSNPGTTNSSCSSSVTAQLQQTCSSSCSNGSCSQNSNIACNSNADCGTNGPDGNPFCLSGDVYQNQITYTCSNPGTTNSSCSSSVTAQLQQTCNVDCLGGICTSIPSVFALTNSGTQKFNASDLSQSGSSQYGGTSAVFSPDGKYIYLGGDNVRKLKASDLSLVGTGGYNGAIAISPDGAYIYTSFGYKLNTSDLSVAAQTSFPLSNYYGSYTNAVAVSPDGNYVYLGGLGGIAEFDSNFNELTSTSSPTNIYYMAFSPSGTLYAVGPQLLATVYPFGLSYISYSSVYYSIAFSPDGYVYLPNANTNTLQKFASSDFTQPVASADLGANSAPVSVAVSSDGYVYVLDQQTSMLQKFNTSDLSQVAETSVNGSSTVLAVSP